MSFNIDELIDAYNSNGLSPSQIDERLNDLLSTLQGVAQSSGSTEEVDQLMERLEEEGAEGNIVGTVSDG